MNRSSRPWLLAGVLAVVAVIGTTPAVTGPASGDASAGSVATRPAEELIDSVGVAVHLGYPETGYARTDAVVAALQDLGVRHVRDELRSDQPEQLLALRRLGDLGIGSSLIVGPRPDQPRGLALTADPRSDVETIASGRAGLVDQVEGLNEFDLWGGDDWPVGVGRWQQTLHDAVASEPRLRDVPVLAPSIAMREDWTTAGTFDGASDRANAHLYPDGLQPGGLLAEKIEAFAAGRPGQTTVLTETGYTNATRAGDGRGQPPVPEQVAAAYVPRLLVGALEAGVERTYLYELLDQVPDPGRTHRERNFGLVRDDFSPKPAYLALRELLRLAAGSPAPDRTVAAGGSGTLGLEVDAGGVPVRQLVLERRDGTFVVLLWRDVSVWDLELQHPLDVVPAPVTLHLDGPGTWTARSVGASRTDLGAGSGRDVTVPVRGDLVAVTLSPAA